MTGRRHPREADALMERAAVALFGALGALEEFEPTRVTFVFDEPCDPAETLVMLELAGARPVAGLESLRAEVAWGIGLREVLDADAAEIRARFEAEVMVGAKTREMLSLAEAAARVSPPTAAPLN